MKSQTPEKQLAGFLAKYDPSVAAVAKAARKKLRARLPGAVEMVYDNYNALVIGFGPSERPSEAILSIALYPRWVNLFFLNGTKLADPQKLLRGRGNQVRNILLVDAAVLDRPAVQALVTEAVEKASKPLEAAARRKLVIRSVSEQQRARRPR